MADLTKNELIMLEKSVNNEIENLEAQARVLNRDILLYNDEELFDYFQLVIDLDDVNDKIVEYKYLLLKIRGLKNA